MSAEEAVLAPERDRRTESQALLIESSRQLAHDSLEAWAEENSTRVAFASIAVELLGKAVLWSKNPVLLVPENDEGSLLKLAGDQPDIYATGLKTIGLKVVLRRAGEVTGALSVPGTRLTRMINVRNGAVHVGAGTDARHVLLDCLTVLREFVARLGLDEAAFFGAYAELVSTLVDTQKTEIARRVSLKRVQARNRLDRRANDLGEVAYAQTNRALEDRRWGFAFRLSGEGFAQFECPECKFMGILRGELDGSEEVDWDVEKTGDGEWEHIPSVYLQPTFAPGAFHCSVCQLRLSDIEELAEAGLPSAQYDVEDENLHPDFDLNEFAQWFYVGE
ncbi:hypothetical protein [Agromyces sp. NPDC058064]|uniref:hypothetical protein n=1 Tax=Agromyces sp. NPDC058064 TaxID=3346322 RepID=UPI0036DDD394